MMTPDALLAADSKALDLWFCEEMYEEDGYAEVHHEEKGGKHDCTSHWRVFKHEGTGRCIELAYSTSYNNGTDEYSFHAREVYPHVITTTVYKDKPQS